ncbi:MAG: alpha/beta hydrolase [Ferruginibacter sp.]
MKRSNTLSFLVILVSLQISCNNAKDSKQAPAEKINIENNGVKIDYTDTGTGVGDTVLLFVHGWCINKTYWTEQEKFFKDRYRIVSIDLPGFGQSGKNRKDWTTENYGKDVDAVMKQLDLKHVILIGHSMSGDIVLEAAANAPERVIGLIGVDNFKNVGAVQDSAGKEAVRHAMDTMRKDFTRVVGDYFKQYLFSKNTDTLVKTRILNDVFHCDSMIAVEAIAPNDFNETTKLKAANKKLYLINSDNYPTDTTKLVADKIPYEILYTPGTGHYSMIETPGKFNALLEQIIEDIKKGKNNID